MITGREKKTVDELIAALKRIITKPPNLIVSYTPFKNTEEVGFFSLGRR
jgi:hypothetical protein